MHFYLSSLSVIALFLLVTITSCQHPPTPASAASEQVENLPRLDYDTIPFIHGGSMFTIQDENDLLLDSAGWISIEGIPFQVEEVESITLLGEGFNSIEIKKFPDEILKFKNLKYLYLGMRGFETVPAEIAQLSKLESLDFQHGSIKRFPPEFTSLKQLRELILLFSAIEELPNNFHELTGLRTLHLGCTDFDKIPPPLFRMKQLKELILTHCEERASSYSPAEIQRLRDSLPNTAVSCRSYVID